MELWTSKVLVGKQQGRYSRVGHGQTREAMTGCGLTRETMILGEGDLNALSPIALAQGTRSGFTREAVAMMTVCRRDNWSAIRLREPTPSQEDLTTNYVSPEHRAERQKDQERAQQAEEKPLTEPSGHITGAVVTWRPWKVLERDKPTGWLEPLLPSVQCLGTDGSIW